MKRRPVTTALILMSLALLAASLAGCAMSPSNRVLAARDAYSGSLRTLTTLRQGGLIDNSTARNIEKARVAVAQSIDLLDLAAQSIPPGQKTSDEYRAALDAYNAALDRYIALLRQAQRK